MGVLRLLAIAAVVVVTGWMALILVARRFPDGLLSELTGFLPACVTAVRHLRRDPRVPRSVKLALLGAGAWVVSPIDLVPEFLPVIGPLDDVIVVALALRFAARRIPREALDEAWTGDRRLLDRLLGHPSEP